MGEGERDDPERRGYDCEADGDGINGSCVGDEGDGALKICPALVSFCRASGFRAPLDAGLVEE